MLKKIIKSAKGTRFLTPKRPNKIIFKDCKFQDTCDTEYFSKECINILKVTLIITMEI